MTFLRMLAEAVNAVAEWPNECVWAADEPMRLCIGYQVGDQAWECTLQQVKREIPDVYYKRDQLVEMTSRIKLPLRPFPEHVREREILARAALLKAAVYLTNIEMRRETAKWLTFLGRLRAAPNGSLIMGDPNEEPVPRPRPRAYLVRT